MSGGLRSEVALLKRNVLEDRFHLIVKNVRIVGHDSHRILRCELNLLKLSEVRNVEEASCIVNSDLGLTIAVFEIDAPVPELFIVPAFGLGAKVVVLKFALKWPDVDLDVVVRLVLPTKREKSFSIFAEKRQHFSIVKLS